MGKCKWCGNFTQGPTTCKECKKKLDNGAEKYQFKPDNVSKNMMFADNDPMAFKKGDRYMTLHAVCDKCKKPLSHIEHQVKCLKRKRSEIKHLYDERGYKRQSF